MGATLVLFRYFKSTNLEKPKLRAKEKQRDTVQTNYSKAISPSFVAPLEDTPRPRFRLERAVLAIEYASNWTST